MNKCLLFVPAKEKTLAKIDFNLDYDVIIDLEDSIADCEKECALCLAKEYIASHMDYVSRIYVRINKAKIYDEMPQLQSYNVGLMIPKFESDEEFDKNRIMISNHRIIALVETPLGIININNIVNTKGVIAIAFGAEDFTASMNMDNENNLLTSIKLQIIMAAKVANVQTFDTPSFFINNLEKTREDIQNSVRLGFDGKLAIHPQQVDIINKEFQNHDLCVIQEIVSIYDELGGGIQIINGRPYEKMHIDRFRKILKESKI